MVTKHFAGLKYSLARSCTGTYAGSRLASNCALPSLGFIKLYQLPRAGYLHTNKQTHILLDILQNTCIQHTQTKFIQCLVKNIFLVDVYFGIYVKWWIFKFGALHKLLKLGNFQVLDSRVWVNYNNCTTRIYADWLSLCDWQKYT